MPTPDPEHRLFGQIFTYRHPDDAPHPFYHTPMILLVPEKQLSDYTADPATVLWLGSDPGIGQMSGLTGKTRIDGYALVLDTPKEGSDD